MRKAWFLIPAVAVAVGVLIWSQRRTGPYFVSGILETDVIRVGSRVGGRVREVAAKEGQRVASGAALLTLEPFDWDERLAQAKATLAAAQAVYDRRRTGLRKEEVEQARAKRDRFKAMLDEAITGARPLDLQILQDRLDAAQAEVTRAESEYERIKALSETERTPKEMYEATRSLLVARAQLDEARHSLALAKEGTRVEQIAQARANVSDAEQALAMAEQGSRGEDIAEAKANLDAASAAVAALQRQMDELTVTSPREAIVEAIDLRPGDLMAASAPMISLIDPNVLWVRAYVPQNRLDLKLGQKVAVRVDSLPNRRFAATISYISREAEFAPGNVQTPEERGKLVFRIKADLEEGLDVLRAGMSADVYFDAAP